MTGARARLLREEADRGDVPELALELDVRVEPSGRDVTDLGHRAAERPDARAGPAERSEEPGRELAPEPLRSDHAGVVEADVRNAEPPPSAERAPAPRSPGRDSSGGAVECGRDGGAVVEACDGHGEDRESLRVVAGAVDGVDDPREVRVRAGRARLFADEAVSAARRQGLLAEQPLERRLHRGGILPGREPQCYEGARLHRNDGSRRAAFDPVDFKRRFSAVAAAEISARVARQRCCSNFVEQLLPWAQLQLQQLLSF